MPIPMNGPLLVDARTIGERRAGPETTETDDQIFVAGKCARVRTVPSRGHSDLMPGANTWQSTLSAFIDLRDRKKPDFSVPGQVHLVAKKRLAAAKALAVDTIPEMPTSIVGSVLAGV